MYGKAQHHLPRPETARSASRWAAGLLRVLDREEAGQVVRGQRNADIGAPDLRLEAVKLLTDQPGREFAPHEP